MTQLLASDTKSALGSLPTSVQSPSLAFEKLFTQKREGNRHKLSVESQIQSLDKATKSNPWLLALCQQRIKSLITSLEAQGRKAYTIQAKLAGRLAINLGGSVLENAAASLDRLTGTPLVAGSAVKGTSRYAALWDIRDTEEELRYKKLGAFMLGYGYMFADQDKQLPSKDDEIHDLLWAARSPEILNHACEKVVDYFRPGAASKDAAAAVGYLSFLPAFPTSAPTFVTEVLTPHSGGNPTPLPFSAIEVGSSWQFSVIQETCGNADWDRYTAECLDHWLRTSLTTYGIGAKTAAGFGWFTIPDSNTIAES